jgi:hypothetical protein
MDNIPLGTQEGGSLIEVDAVVGYMGPPLQRLTTDAYFQCAFVSQLHPSTAIVLLPKLAQ